MGTKNKDIHNNFEDYKKNLECVKYTNNNFIVTTKKSNHPNAYYGESEVKCSYTFGNTKESADIKNFDANYYTFSYLSDKFNNKMLARLDMGGATHRNNAPGIPLELTCIRSPHFHEYREDGHLLAYEIEGLNYENEESLKFDFHQGYKYFCNRLNIHSQTNESLSFAFQPSGLLPFVNEEIDPNLGVDFKEID